eukprot:6153640-Amphidinium_carterae.1
MFTVVTINYGNYCCVCDLGGTTQPKSTKPPPYPSESCSRVVRSDGKCLLTHLHKVRLLPATIRGGGWRRGVAWWTKIGRWRLGLK